MSRTPNQPRSLATKRPVFHIDGVELAAAPLDAGLHLVATPIGNLADVTVRSLRVLAAADVIACEDTRVSAKLLSRYGITTPLVRCDDHTTPGERRRLIDRIAAGESIALVSDAGTPLVSDPGFRLVREAIAAGVTVSSLPGPSAVLAAVTSAGLPAERFLFAGFLPAKAGERRRVIAELAAVPAALVFYEAPHRLPESLQALADGLGPREAAVARELTKLHEEIRRGTLADLAGHYAEAAVRGEIVVVIAPPGPSGPPGEAELDDLLRAALQHDSVKDAAAAVATATGLPRRKVYARALALTGRSGGGTA